MTDSNIEWTEKTWNPLAGCTIKSPGCTNCYAMKMAKRCEAMGIDKYAGTTKTVNGKAVWTGRINFDEKALLAPLRRKKPTMYFVNSMSDLFHEDVLDETIDKVFAVMALCPQHTFQVLTKRADRMRDYLTDIHVQRIISAAHTFDSIGGADLNAEHNIAGDPIFPLPNVWLGISGENQHWSMHRATDLVETPAAVRFLSYEPALGPIDVEPFVKPPREWSEGWANNYPYQYPKHRLDWIIIGGESGPGAREFHPEWARSVIEQCAGTNTKIFMKQMGGANKARMPEIPDDLMIREYPITSGRLSPE